MVLPGLYEVRLTVGGQEYRQPIAVKLDPRLNLSLPELQRQLDLAQKVAAAMNATYEAYNRAAQLRRELADRMEKLKPKRKSQAAMEAAKAAEEKAQGLTDASGPPAGFGPANRDLTRLMIAVDQSDSPPASEIVETYAAMCQDANGAFARWSDLQSHDLPRVNALLAKLSLPPVTASAAVREMSCGN